MARIALIRGPYLRPDGVRPWEHLNAETDHEVVAFESNPPRFDTGALDLPVRQLRWPDGAVDLFGYEHFFSRAIRKMRFPSDYLVGVRGLTDEFDVLHTSENFNLFSLQAALATRGDDAKFAFSVGENIPYPLYQRNPVLWHVKRFVNAKAAGITATTPVGKRALIHEGVSHEKVSVVPNAVDSNRFAPMEDPVDPTELGFPASCAESMNVLFVHGLREQKGIYDLLEAFESLNFEGDVVRLLLVGADDLNSRRSQYVRKATDVHWVERVPYERMPELYDFADISVLPSVTTPNNEEQFGMAILEAMSCETATVVTDVGGLPYLVEDGETSIVVRERSPMSLRSAIETLLSDSDRRSSLAKAGRARAVEEFRPDVVSDRLKSFYDDLFAT